MPYDQISWTNRRRTLILPLAIQFCLLAIVWQLNSTASAQNVSTQNVQTQNVQTQNVQTQNIASGERTASAARENFNIDQLPENIDQLNENRYEFAQLNFQPNSNAHLDPSANSDPVEPTIESTDMNRMRSMAGERAFQRACTTCHDAERSFAKTKTLAGWTTTVRRMAAKSDADIEDHEIVPIARHLNSIRGVAEGAESSGNLLAQTTLNATVSLLTRIGNDEQPLEKPGFFVDAWVSGEWRGDNALSAKVTACTSCHSDRNNSAGFTLELVEASFKVDLDKLAGCDRDCGLFSAIQGDLEAGRFVVPFGAFATMSHPGIYRTVTNPLMFNMGRRAGSSGPLQPVLPAPFSDEGVKLHLDALIFGDIKIGVDGYAVNGLQSGGGPIFNDSRRYYDNNREPFTGGRVTVGNSLLKLGGSLMTGQLQDDGDSPVSSRLGGADVTLRLNDQFRFYFEYAIRSEDSTFVNGAEDHVYGTVYEAEMKVSEKWGVSLLARYDTLEHRHSAFGSQSTERITVGLNTSILDGSLLIINHEHWVLANNDDYDVIALRWVTTY